MVLPTGAPLDILGLCISWDRSVLVDSIGLLFGITMKAVLEFTYPQDEDRLRYALNGETAILGLREVQGLLENREYKKALEKVRAVLRDCGDE